MLVVSEYLLLSEKVLASSMKPDPVQHLTRYSGMRFEGQVILPDFYN